MSNGQPGYCLRLSVQVFGCPYLEHINMLLHKIDFWLQINGCPSDNCISIFGCPATFLVVLGARTTEISNAGNKHTWKINIEIVLYFFNFEKMLKSRWNINIRLFKFFSKFFQNFLKILMLIFQRSYIGHWKSATLKNQLCHLLGRAFIIHSGNKHVKTVQTGFQYRSWSGTGVATLISPFTSIKVIRGQQNRQVHSQPHRISFVEYVLDKVVLKAGLK